jgi:hypothetical protein
MAKQPTPPAVGPDIGGATASPAVALTAACVSAQNTGPLEFLGTRNILRFGVAARWFLALSSAVVRGIRS